MQKYELILNYKIFPRNIFYNIEFSNKKSGTKLAPLNSTIKHEVMNYPLELGDAALLFFAPCSSLISASSSSMRLMV